VRNSLQDFATVIAETRGRALQFKCTLAWFANTEIADMWQSIPAYVLGWFGIQKIANELMGGWTLNRDEAYVDRIKREFNLRDHHTARTLFDSSRAYWEKLYGNDPVTSQNHPGTPPRSLLPRQPGAIDPGHNLLDPAPTDGNAFGRFGTGGQFVPGLVTSSRPLYETQQIISPPETIDESGPVRRLVRVGSISNATPFDSGAPAVPFVPPSPILSPGRPATIEERSQIFLPPSAASPGTTSPDDLEAFRRQWLRTYMEP
jgi:hypothetical protein